LTIRILLFLAVFIQVASAVFFVSDILLTISGSRANPVSWQTRELLQIGAAVGLVLGIIPAGLVLRHSLRTSARASSQLRAVSGAFADLLSQRFAEWGLTRAERDVALFAIKGMTIGEIATLRDRSQGTVKAQTNAIYRKAGVSSHAQLLSLFIEELMTEGLEIAELTPAQTGPGTANGHRDRTQKTG
jgi:DNA-binding CsgD family transcriptional regulator